LYYTRHCFWYGELMVSVNYNSTMSGIKWSEAVVEEVVLQGELWRRSKFL